MPVLSNCLEHDYTPMQLVTPSDVAIAVRIEIMTLMMVFHVSCLIFVLILLVIIY